MTLFQWTCSVSTAWSTEVGKKNFGNRTSVQMFIANPQDSCNNNKLLLLVTTTSAWD